MACPFQLCALIVILDNWQELMKSAETLIFAEFFGGGPARATSPNRRILAKRR